MYPSVGHIHIWVQHTTPFETSVYWSKLKKDTRERINICTPYNLMNRWRQRGSELMLSWPISFLFSISHVDLWCLGDSINYEGKYYFLMQCVILLNLLLLFILLNILYYRFSTLYVRYSYNIWVIPLSSYWWRCTV